RHERPGRGQTDCTPLNHPAGAVTSSPTPPHAQTPAPPDRLAHPTPPIDHVSPSTRGHGLLCLPSPAPATWVAMGLHCYQLLHSNLPGAGLPALTTVSLLSFITL